MKTTTDIINIRPSSVSMAHDCLWRWYNQSILGVKSRGGFNTLRGSSLHAGAASILENCIEAGEKKFNITEAKDKAAQEVTDLTADNEYVFEDFQTKELAIDEAVNGVDVWKDEILTEIEIPQSVEIYATAEIADRITINGTADQVMKDGMIADIKTGAKKTSGSKHIMQLSVYQRLAQMQGAPVNNTAQIQNIVFGKTGIKSHLISVNLDYDYTKRVIDDIANRIQHWRLHPEQDWLIFPPNVGSYLCSDKYCPMYNDCYIKNSLPV